MCPRLWIVPLLTIGHPFANLLFQGLPFPRCTRDSTVGCTYKAVNQVCSGVCVWQEGKQYHISEHNFHLQLNEKRINFQHVPCLAHPAVQVAWEYHHLSATTVTHARNAYGLHAGRGLQFCALLLMPAALVPTGSTTTHRGSIYTRTGQWESAQPHNIFIH